MQPYKPARRFWFALLRELTAENIVSQPIWRVRQSAEELSVLFEEFEPYAREAKGH
jgi:hypothetical protein